MYNTLLVKIIITNLDCCCPLPGFGPPAAISCKVGGCAGTDCGALISCTSS